MATEDEVIAVVDNMAVPGKKPLTVEEFQRWKAERDQQRLKVREEII